MLDPFSRGAIIALSALCVVGTFALAPSRARSSMAESRMMPWPRLAAPAADSIAAVPIRRDPFAEPAPADAAQIGMTRAPSSSQRQASIGLLPSNLPLPSNLTIDSIAAIPGAASPSAADRPRITAIVTGAHPYAMIETAGVHDIKGIGDRVAGVPIISIDLSGIRLQNGDHLTVDPTGSSE